jgi:hypothetical protein
VLTDPSRQAWLEKVHLHWVPHALSINRKSERVPHSKLLLTVLMEQKVSSYQQIVTGDEFFLHYPRDSIWTASGDELSQRNKRKTNTEKCLVSILWSVQCIHNLLDVPKGTTYNRAFFFDAVMSNLIENVWSGTRKKTSKRWLIHMDNACPHNSGRAQRRIEAS